jgi:paraquat-inducible protein B
VKTQSLLSILIGGIAFETAPNSPLEPPAEANTVFTLYEDRNTAFEPAAENPQTYSVIFNESVRGLTPGAPVEFRGIKIGEVTDVRAQIDLKGFVFSVPVTITLDPRRLGVNVLNNAAGMDLNMLRHKLIDSMVAHGVRAQLRSGNLLTGALYVSFDSFPDASPATVDWSQTPARLPTVRGQLEVTEATVENVIKKIDKLPLQEIGDNLRKSLADLDRTLVTADQTLHSTDRTLVSARGTIENANGLVGPNSPQAQQLSNTLEEVGRAARSLRVLADYLERHPESLIYGKKGEPK